VKAGWKLMKLGAVLAKAAETIEADATKEYSEVTVKLWGKGVVERRRVLGSEISGRRFVARSGNFIVSRIDARNGAMGLIPASLDGGLVTNDFPLFEANSERLELAYLGWLCRTQGFVDLCVGASEGSTNRVRLKEDRFLTLEIPLPPLAEQRRIVARIEALAGEIEEAKHLRREAVDASEALLRSILIHAQNVVNTPMRKLVTQRQPDVTVQPDETYQFAGVYCFGRGVFKSVRKSGAEFSYPKLTRVRAGEFVYPKLMAWEGALGVVPTECDGLVVSTEFPVFEVNRNFVLPEVLDVHFRNPTVWPALSGSSTGTNVRRRRLNPGDFLAYDFPLPPREVQETLKTVMSQTDTLKRLQSETAAEIDALLPAILDRAFKGEL
jgi:type I restriction enzyme S subunit